MTRSGGQRVRLVWRDDDEDGEFTVTGTELVDGCSIQPQPGTETYDEGQRSRQVFRVYGPERLAALRSWDAIDLEHEPGTDRWERATLDGRPSRWPRRGGGCHHVELAASVTAG